MQLYNHGSHPPPNTIKIEAVATPFTALPYDILWNTFSYLSQAEVLEAMAVCHTWYENVPYYTTHLWRNVTVSAKDGGLINRRKAQCLGAHVHTVIVSFYKGDATFQRDMGEIVERTEGSVQAAVLCFCSSFQSTGFYSGLGMLGKHLTRLVFTNHLGNNLDFFDIMPACPHLRYFEMQRPGVLVTRNIPSSSTTFPKLTDLLMDGTPCADFDFELVLKSCPGLCFLGFTQRKWVPGDIASLTRHCGRLQSLYFVDTELSFAKLRRQGVIDQQQRSLCDMGRGLRELSIQPVERHGALSVSVLVDRHLGTLERLRLLNCFYSHLGPGTVARSLTQVVLSNVESDSHDLVRLFGNCPNLADLTLAQGISSFTTDVIDALTTNLNRLERLDFDLVGNNPIRRRMQQSITQGLFRLFSGIQRNEAMRLRELYIIGTNIPIDDSVLRSIAGIDTVEQLGISSAFCTDPGLAAFAERLAQRTHTPLRRVALYNINAVFAPNVMSALGSVGGLEDLCLTACTRVTGDGLRRLSRKAKNLASLRLFRCIIIDDVDWINEAKSSVGAVYYDWEDDD